jgi:hypothetical protein
MRDRGWLSPYLVSFTFVLALGSCGPGEAPPIEWVDPINPVPSDLLLEPANNIAIVDYSTTPIVPTPVTYTVKDRTSGADVTATARFDADRGIGNFEGNVFTPTKSLTLLSRSALIGATAPGGDQGFAWSTVLYTNLKDGQLQQTQLLEDDGSIPIRSGIIKFNTRVRQLDLAIVMDTTGSMGGAIDNLKANLKANVLPMLAAEVDNAAVAIVDEKDYPTQGETSDYPVKVLTAMTDNFAVAQQGVDALSASGGGDGPEAQIPAMYYALTGKELSWMGGMIPAHASPSGSFGGVDFHEGSLPVVVLITDVSWHDLRSAPYLADVFNPPSLEDLKRKFIETKAVFVDVTAGPETQAQELSDATGSNVPPSAFGSACGAGMCCTGISGAARTPDGPNGTCRLNFKHMEGMGVSTSIINALQSFITGRKFDFTIATSSDPKNPNNYDTRGLITQIRAMDEGAGALGCAPRNATDTNGDGVKDTFPQVDTGSDVCFEVTLAAGTNVQRDYLAQEYKVRLDLVDKVQGFVFDARALDFVMPPKDLVRSPFRSPRR